jgi:hypothetical protein
MLPFLSIVSVARWFSSFILGCLSGIGQGQFHPHIICRAGKQVNWQFDYLFYDARGLYSDKSQENGVRLWLFFQDRILYHGDQCVTI